MRSLWLTVAYLLASSCPPLGPADRKPGDRTPRSAACEVLDGTRCLLPWPSNTYTVTDPTTATGLRLNVAKRSLPVLDDPTPLSRMDGFSVATSLAVGFPAPLQDGLEGHRGTTAVRLFNAPPGRGQYGADVPLRLHVVPDGASDAVMLVGWPLVPLEYDTDYVAVVLDEVRPAAGGAFPVPRAVQVALGLVTPADADERDLAAYHAPTRALLARRGVDVSHVVRVWDFTTRSAGQVTEPWAHMRARALDVVSARGLDVQVTDVTPRLDGGVVVSGSVGNVPSFVSDAGGWALDDAGLPAEVGARTVPFRVVFPPGQGPLPVVVFGHGTGNDVTDPNLDDTFVDTGAAKLNLQFDGWTRTTVAGTFASFEHVLSGSERSTARLGQSLVNAAALEASLSAQLGDVLTAPLLAGQPNPAAGRTILVDRLAWFGSSLGGTLGFAHAQAEPRISAAVVNVPGAGCTQFFLLAEQWQQLDAVFALATPSTIDRSLALILSQGSWDLVDGAAWSTVPGATRKPLLVQESIGDPVMPNIASELVASAAHASLVGPAIVPVSGLEALRQAAALTQFRVPATAGDSGALHAFVGKDTPAGVAAREQVADFLRGAWAGQAVAHVPPSCVGRDAGCDFQAQ